MRSRQLSSNRSALLAEHARRLRHALTPSEALLWSSIRAGRLGVVFRRQVPLLGRFSADFCAPAVKLVVEVDGGYHIERRAADARRDRVLERAGYRVLRFTDEQVVRLLGFVLECIREEIGRSMG